MKDIESVKSLCQKFWEFENVSDVFSDVRYASSWHMIRMKAYYYLAMKCNIFSSPHPYKRDSAWRLKFFFRAFCNFLSSIILLFRFQGIETVVVEHHRSKLHGSTTVDIYSYFYAQKLKKEGNSILVFSRTDNGKIEKNDGFDRLSIDIIELTRSVFSYALSPLIRDHSNTLLKAKEMLGPNIALMLKRAKIEFAFSYYVYKFIFSILSNVKHLVIVDGYSSRAGMIMAAKSKGIKVTELQHGVATKYHLGYSYPDGRCNRQCLPDELLVWSDFWMNSLKSIFPLPVRVNSENFITYETARYWNEEKENSVIVLSQGAISTMLAGCVLKNIEKFKEKEVFYKLHPSEYDSWRNNEALLALSKFRNVNVVKNVDLYRLLSRCKYQVGVFSTALFEGIELGCELILVNLPGIEYWEDLSVDYVLLDDWTADV